MVEQAIGSNETLAVLREHKDVLRERFGVTELALFGSTLRDEARPDSDIDILVSFEEQADSKGYFGVQCYIEDLLGRPVDLVTRKALRTELRPHIEAEAVDVFAAPERRPPMPDRPSPRRWDFYVRDMIEACERVVEYAADMDKAAFLDDRRTYYAVLHNIALVGEAATHIPDQVRKGNADVPWGKIIATRNVIIHAYIGVDDDRVWGIVRDDIPELAPRLRALLEEAEGEARPDSS